MTQTTYLLIAVLVSGLITFALRALPFAILKPLRKNKFVQLLGQWMPAGILLMLAVVVLQESIVAAPSKWWIVLAASGVTIITHILTKRRALISIAVGTASYVALLAAFG
ncbi:branched-chain amino acid transporter permease [Leucobacter sp. 1207-22]|uniref:branched-chain amino acid transporter permease n=1 Tax=Leucobacter sp. 1207-22 TaxID=2604456 RepID=UPI0040640C83